MWDWRGVKSSYGFKSLSFTCVLVGLVGRESLRRWKSVRVISRVSTCVLIFVACTFNRELYSCWRYRAKAPDSGDYAVRLRCDAGEPLHASAALTESIHLKHKSYPGQTETLTHTSTSVCLHSRYELGLDTFPEDLFVVSTADTHLHTYITGVHTLFPIPSFSHAFPHPLQGSWLSSARQFIVNYQLSHQRHPFNTASDPLYFSLFISVVDKLLPSRFVRRKKERKKKDSFLPQLSRRESWHCKE